ncbi:putative phage abortive infection protein [Pectobacterium polaris]|uniref:putative phage abortive infection protein n=1 Tax=Pectobacterium polaris TaxID=2042057 RepID=UPI002B248AB4|nr:putative phage abortive infection protein [Pectobacterium polaris]
MKKTSLAFLNLIKALSGAILGFAFAFGIFIFIIVMMALLNKNDLPATFSAILSFITVIATAWAAYAAGRSAKVSVKALEITKDTADKSIKIAEESLNATYMTNKRTAFEQHYSLLLSQHNIYHEKVCNYLDDKEEINSTKEKLEIYSIFNYRFESGKLERSMQFLTGHAVLSPYMRILYHILKHISDNFYDPNASDKQRRQYSSPLRSVIRNDVMYLIAINALNITGESEKVAGYIKYQNMLRQFNFFEHAVFINPQEPNITILPQKACNMFINDEKSNYSRYYNETLNMAKQCKNHDGKMSFNSPAFICISVYDNPLHETTDLIYDEIKKKILSDLTLDINNLIECHRDHLQRIDNISNGIYGNHDEERGKENTKEHMASLKDHIKNGNKTVMLEMTKTHFASSRKYYEEKSGATGQDIIEMLRSINNHEEFYIYFDNENKKNEFFSLALQEITKAIDKNKDEIKNHQIN